MQAEQEKKQQEGSRRRRSTEKQRRAGEQAVGVRQIGAEKGLFRSRRYYLQTPGMRGESSAMFLPIIIKINFVFRYAFLKKSTKEYSQM